MSAAMREKLRRDMDAWGRYPAWLIDPLTRLPNRGYAQDLLEALLPELDGQESGVGVILFDIDWMMIHNDQHGHEVGDRLICMVGARLREALGSNGVIARIGGEEFVAIVPIRDDDGEAVVPRRGDSPMPLSWLAHLLAGHVALGSIDAERAPGGRVQATVSFGTAWTCKAATAPSLWKHADKALYQSKAHGRGPRPPMPGEGMG